MAKRVFTEEERAEYREKMLDAGFDLLKQYGMTHMSVAKITEAAGIGVSTFYNFFASKEEYVYEVLQYRRRKIPELFRKHLQQTLLILRCQTWKYTVPLINHHLQIRARLCRASLFLAI